jgi:hypothetical protein
MGDAETGMATIMVNIFDGTRQPIVIGPSVKNVLIRVIDGWQKEVSADFHATASVRFEVPFFDGPGDNYAVIAFADNYLQAGFTPVPVSSKVVQMVDLMLLPKQGTFNFGGASWANLRQTYPEVSSILSHGAANDQAAQARYEELMEEKPAVLACLWNLMTAMAGIRLPQGSPVSYLKEIIWQDTPGDELFAPAQDRFYAWADKNLVDQVKTAAQQGEFAPEINPSFFHKGATSSYKQIQFGEANVQLTFHEKNIRSIDGVDCVAVEPDIDYFKDLGAHALLEVLPNFLSGGLTDPKIVYVLRWIAGRHAGVPDFNPPYTIVA